MIFRTFLWSDRPLSDPGEARTLDPLIKSQLLYQLSYGVICIGLFLNCGAKLGTFYEPCKFFCCFFTPSSKKSYIEFVLVSFPFCYDAVGPGCIDVHKALVLAATK